jgi:hypothetical protein
MTRRTKQSPDTIKVPDAWKNDFQQHVMKTNFVLALSQPMIEFLSAVADDVHWDRSNFCTIHRPDNWIATENSLTRRGLIVRKPKSEIEKIRQGVKDIENWRECNYCELTPAGKALVELFRVSGIFVESDNAVTKRARKNG